MIKILKYDFKEDIELLVIGDIHVGDKLCNTKMLIDTINYIQDNDNCYCFLNGDLLNMALKSSVSFEYETTSPHSEYTQLVNLLEPIKHKILGVTLGNHDDRLLKESGIDIISFLCKDLGITDVYCKYQALLLIRIQSEKRNATHKIFITHGIGAGGKMIGSKANFLAKLTGIVSNANCYVINHTHTPLHFTDATYYVDSKHHDLRQNIRHFINQPAFLHYGGYGQRFNLNPTSSYQYVISMNSKKLTVRELMI